MLSAWMRTRPKSWPKRASIEPRVAESRGCPEVSRTWRTIGGTPSARSWAAWPVLSFAQASQWQLPAEERAPAHFRWSVVAESGDTGTGCRV